AMLGDWNGVLKAFEAGQKAWKQSGGAPAISEHLAGVAYANLGDLEAAQRHWRSAAEGPGAIGRAQANLADSKLPVGQRHGPWGFPVEDWLPSALIAPLGDLVAAEGRKGSVKRAGQRYFDQ